MKSFKLMLSICQEWGVVVLIGFGEAVWGELPWSMRPQWGGNTDPEAFSLQFVE